MTPACYRRSKYRRLYSTPSREIDRTMDRPADSMPARLGPSQPRESPRDTWTIHTPHRPLAHASLTPRARMRDAARPANHDQANRPARVSSPCQRNSLHGSIQILRAAATHRAAVPGACPKPAAYGRGGSPVRIPRYGIQAPTPRLALPLSPAVPSANPRPARLRLRSGSRSLRTDRQLMMMYCQMEAYYHRLIQLL